MESVPSHPFLLPAPLVVLRDFEIGFVLLGSEGRPIFIILFSAEVCIHSGSSEIGFVWALFFHSPYPHFSS